MEGGFYSGALKVFHNDFSQTVPTLIAVEMVVPRENQGKPEMHMSADSLEITLESTDVRLSNLL